jgi:hypothetical protein
MKRQIWQARLARVVLMMVCNVGLMSGPAVAQTYTVTDVGTLGGTQTNGVAINANGQVTGDALTAGNHQRHGFLASDGVATAIPATTHAAETAPMIHLVLSFIDPSLIL